MTDQNTMDKIKTVADRQLKELASLREQFQKPGMSFSAIPETELYRRLTVNAAAPQIIGQGWTSGTAPGAQASYSVTISNPGSATLYPLFVTIFFGLANFAQDVTAAVAGREQVWPYRNTEPFSLAAGASVSKTFKYVVPLESGGSTYTGNAVLWQGSFHDVGSYFDRGLFYVNVT